MDPVFSVVMTSYNCERWVGAAIESVLAQTMADWELLVVDDASSDGSWDVITRYRDERIRAARFPTNRGGCAAYNAAYAVARGQYIADLDCDDCFHPTKLELQRAYLDAHLDIGVCATHIEEIDADGVPISRESQNQLYAPWFNVECDLNDPATWVGQNRICHSSAVIRKELHDRVGSFDEHLVYTPDWTFWIRALIAGVRFHVLAEPLVSYRNRGDNLTHRNPLVSHQEYAAFCRQTFHPYLLSIARYDLVKKNIAILVQQVAAIGNAADLLLLLDVLLPSATSSSAAEADEQPSRDVMIADLLFDERRRNGDLEAATRWLHEQRQSWERVATERGRELEELRTWNTALQAAQLWHDEQRQSWERVATERGRELEELRTWAQEQRRALDWHVDQRTQLERQLAEAAQARPTADHLPLWSRLSTHIAARRKAERSPSRLKGAGQWEQTEHTRSQ